MKAQLVNVVADGRNETVVMVTTGHVDAIQRETGAWAEATAWLVDEGWTVAIRSDSPFTGVVRRVVEVMGGSFVAVEPTAPVPGHALPRFIVGGPARPM